MSAKKNHDDDSPRRRGRPPGPSNVRPGIPADKDRPAGNPAGHAPTLPIHGATPAGPPDIPPDISDAPSPGDLPDDRRVRKNGTPVPPIVQKIAAIVDARGIRNVALEGPQGAAIGENRLYHWRMKAGQPSIAQALRVASFLDVPVEYLIDDDVPVLEEVPRRWEATGKKMADAVSSAGLSLEVVETYLTAIKVAQSFDIGPGQAINVLATAGVERKKAMEGRPHWGTPGPAAHLDGVSERDRQARSDEEDRRRNGGPRPRTG